MDARAANDRIAAVAERLRFVSRVPMVCECSDPDCKGLIMIDLGLYRRIRRDSDAFLTFPAHRVEGGQTTERGDGYWLQQRPPGLHEERENGTG
jgi:hypothetical protein